MLGAGRGAVHSRLVMIRPLLTAKGRLHDNSSDGRMDRFDARSAAALAALPGLRPSTIPARSSAWPACRDPAERAGARAVCLAPGACAPGAQAGARPPTARISRDRAPLSRGRSFRAQLNSRVWRARTSCRLPRPCSAGILSAFSGRGGNPHRRYGGRPPSPRAPPDKAPGGQQTRCEAGADGYSPDGRERARQRPGGRCFARDRLG